MDEITTGIARAVGLAGSQVQLASELGVTQQAVSKWLGRGWVPLDRATQIAGRYFIPADQLANPKLVRILEAQRLLLSNKTGRKRGVDMPKA